jgi:hypothetical protein
VWGQQPKLYRETFRMVADVIHNNTCRATMMWSPNIGCAYPFPWGQVYNYCANQTLSAADLDECDANGDGVVGGARHKPREAVRRVVGAHAVSAHAVALS